MVEGDYEVFRLMIQAGYDVVVYTAFSESMIVGDLGRLCIEYIIFKDKIRHRY